MRTENTEQTSAALTMLSEDERLFRDSVYEFADREIRPLVREMDEHAKIQKTLLDKLFDLGAFTLSLGDAPPQILVSREVHGGDYARQLLIDLHHKPIRPPQDPAWLPGVGFVKWHHEEVFKGPARA